ncbi:MAG TPA: hypothetical protein VFW78_01540 [Bacteroidia bacterium]|nr:hypothetical protein [Bacteroidia bacterium]
MKRTISLLTVLLLVYSCGQKNTVRADYKNGAWINSWENTLTEAVMVDMFPPPIAGRIYAYSNLAAYEALCKIDPAKKSISDRLNGFDKMAEPAMAGQCDFTISALTAFCEVGRSLVYTKNILSVFEQHVLDSLKATGITDETIKQSADYGKVVAAIIMKRAAADHFKETRGMERYTLGHEEVSWEPTPPDFMDAAEPHWSLISTFAIDSASAFRPKELPVPFSIKPGSDFYKTAVEVMETGNNLDSNQLSAAKFWDDNPGVSAHSGHMKRIDKKMSPGGH